MESKLAVVKTHVWYSWQTRRLEHESVQLLAQRRPNDSSRIWRCIV